jgi:hypothetical protein
VREEVPSWFRVLYAGGYARMAANLPKTYGFAYRCIDRRVLETLAALSVLSRLSTNTS